MRYPSIIADYMRADSFSIQAHDSLRTAEQRMNERGVRELPVSSDSRCCGVISQQDLCSAAVHGLAQLEATVRDVMGDDFYLVLPATPLAHVVRTMAAQGYHYAVVVERDTIKGIFTTDHALAALSELLEQQQSTRDGIGPGDVRAVVLTEHSHVRCLLQRARAATNAVRAPSATESDLRSLQPAMKRLLTAMTSQVDLEDRALAPALAALPGFGRERADQLVQEHRRQANETRDMVAALAEPDQPAPTLAGKLQGFIEKLEADLSDEEALLLSSDLLRNDGIVTECTAG